MKVKYLVRTHVNEVWNNKTDGINIVSTLGEAELCKAVQEKVCDLYRVTIEEVRLN